MSKNLGGIIKHKRIGYFRRDLVVLEGCLELELELRCHSLEPHISFIYLFKVSRIVIYPFIVSTSERPLISIWLSSGSWSSRLLQLFRYARTSKFMGFFLRFLFFSLHISLFPFSISSVDISYVIHYISYHLCNIHISLRLFLLSISFCHMGAAVCLRLVHFFSHLNGSGFCYRFVCLN